MAVSLRHTNGTTLAAGAGDDDEACPVCKTTRYFNKDMEFLIHPECYHRMCKTCVDRIFKDGPNQCPYAGCHKTLRPRGFKTAYFADLAVERDVDIRRRVAAVFNKVEDDFESLESYNDYLEERNRRLARETDDARHRRLAAEQDAARERRLQDLRDDADERASAARFREEMLDSLQNADVGRAAEAVHKIVLKKRGQQQQQHAGRALMDGGGGLSIRGLRDKKAAAADAAAESRKPYDPFGGLDLAPRRVDLAPARLGQYGSEWLDDARSKHEFTVGGYSADEYLTRALFEAFSGLGVFVDEEKDR
ncbi:CDK-activating kinase assembly factor MAT1 [Cordyceps fumosorosea ARSEF 2679]|uniref:CDK-activating kinase assembly factor MAT1 n=1 Tax=Cordyceps fumosorosea (strain ARSEF 2679) TaxID=1081104 RepID=A0A167WJZ6_CORFA|nr:CDK-activating kinase assembly factor MAT1 [Cordyceps fumosorosea ARSEF 2679]OAA63888.1 CDK-activating kinase assembly factor MAT1 [Cordyceps fumosorosea ARSEF 2679]